MNENVAFQRCFGRCGPTYKRVQKEPDLKMCEHAKYAEFGAIANLSLLHVWGRCAIRYKTGIDRHEQCTACARKNRRFMGSFRFLGLVEGQWRGTKGLDRTNYVVHACKVPSSRPSTKYGAKVCGAGIYFDFPRISAVGY